MLMMDFTAAYCCHHLGALLDVMEQRHFSSFAISLGVLHVVMSVFSVFK